MVKTKKEEYDENEEMNFGPFKPILLKPQSVSIHRCIYEKGLLKHYSLEKGRSLGMGEEIPLKKTKTDGEEEH